MNLPLIFSLCTVLWALVLVVFLWRQSRRAGIVSAAVITALGAFSFALAKVGVFDNFTLPPPLFFLLIGTFVATAILARKTPLPHSEVWLVGLQSFRIVVELLIHEAVLQKVAPPQFTWTGLNFDILTGLTAPIVALLIATGHAKRTVVLLWNIAGSLLLFWVVMVAVLSMPLPFQVFHPDNTWIVHAPYIWLPIIFVSSALYLHILVFRKLSSDSGGR